MAIERLPFVPLRRIIHEYLCQGRPINNPATTAWQRTCAKAGLSDFRFHDLRHTWATRLREQGVPDRIIVHLGGWCSSQMLNYYSRQSKVDVSNIEGYK